MLNNIAKKCCEAATNSGFWEEYEKIESLKELNLPRSFPEFFLETFKRLFISEKLLLIVTELAEAHEARRNLLYSSKKSFEHCVNFINEPNKKNELISFEKYVKDTFEDEIADTLIRIFDLAGKLDIDLDFHVREKMKYNSKRKYKHGKIC